MTDDATPVAGRVDRPGDPAAPTVDPTDAASPVGDRPPRQLTGRFLGLPRWVRLALLTMTFWVLACCVVLPKVAQVGQFSPTDEVTYADYVHSVTQGDLFMKRNQPLSDWVYHERACRGIGTTVSPDPKLCASFQPPAERGVNSADIDPPTYYWLTAVMAQPVMWVGAADNLVTAARITGTVWAAFAMLAVYLLAFRLSRSRGAGWFCALAVILVSLYRQQYTAITPHATDMLVGAVAGLLILLWWNRRLGWYLPVLVGVLSVSTKISNLAIAVVLCLFLACIAVWPSRVLPSAERRRAALGAAGVAVGAGVATLIFLVIRSRVGLAGPNAFSNYDRKSFPLLETVGQGAGFFGSVNTGELRVYGWIWTVALMGAALCLWAGWTRPATAHGVDGQQSSAAPAPAIMMRALGAGLTIGAVVAPVVICAGIYVGTSQFVPIAMRYGLALAPLWMSVAARLLLRSRTAFAIGAVVLIIPTVLNYTLELPPWKG